MHVGLVVAALKTLRHHFVAAVHNEQAEGKCQEADERVDDGRELEAIAGLFRNTGQDEVSEGQDHHPQHHERADDGHGGLHLAVGTVVSAVRQDEFDR